MIKYIIWGAGTNGTILQNFSEKGSVLAIIDEYTNETSLKGIPIIKYHDYLNKYMDYPIIVSVDKCDEIIKMLDKDGVAQYYVYMEEYYNVIKFLSQVNHEQFAKYCADMNQPILLAGNSLLNIFVYNVLKKYAVDVSIKNTNGKKILDWLKEKQQLQLYEGQREALDIVELINTGSFCEHPELEIFRETHKGKRCFIVGTGPSLRIEDLNKLLEHDEICISVNGIFKGFHLTNWRPNYYMISDPKGSIQWKEEIIKMDVKEKLVADVAFLFDEELPENIHKWHMVINKEKERHPLFSDDFSKASYHGYTITYDGALQLAAYMGFEKIYLLGVDCSQPKDGEQHFVKNYQSEKYKNEVQHPEIQKLAYESAREYADLHGIHIYNASRGGELEVFERVDFDTLF